MGRLTRAGDVLLGWANMESAAAHRFLAAHRNGVLVTIRSDGRPQPSSIVYHWDGRTVRISVTATRAKTANLKRDPRAALHVASADFWQYVVADGTAELSPVSEQPGDAVGRDLLDLYDAIAPTPHPDRDEFFEAMVSERRLVITLTPTSFYGAVS